MNRRLDTIWSLLNQNIEDLKKRVDILEAKEASATFDAISQVTLVEAIELAPQSVSIRYITDGLREGGGTGVPAYFDPISGDWLRISDNGVVTT